MLIARLCHDKKAQDVKVLEMRELTSFTDYFVICSGESTTQVRAIADYIGDVLGKGKYDPSNEKAPKIKYAGVEGLSFAHWVLMDYSDVIVHIFETETRGFYNLEKLWLDAPKVDADESQTDVGGKN